MVALHADRVAPNTLHRALHKFLRQLNFAFIINTLFVYYPLYAGESRIFIEAEVEPKNPLIQEPVLYVLRLYRESHLQKGYFLTPEIPQAVVRLKQTFAPRQVEYRGQSYEMLEQHYVLYPQSTGKIKLPAPVFSSQELYVKGKPFELAVRAAIIADTPWIVADKLEISEVRQKQQQQWHAGNMIERQIILTAENTLSIFLPKIALPEQPGLVVQSLPAILSEQGNNPVSAQRIERMRIILQQPGRYRLPPIHIKWWNNLAQRMEIATLKSRILTVNPTPFRATKNDQSKPDRIAREENLPKKNNSLKKPIDHLILWAFAFIIFFAMVFYFSRSWFLIEKIKHYLSTQKIKKSLVQAFQAHEAKLIRRIMIQSQNDLLLHDSVQLQNVLTALDKSLYAAPTTSQQSTKVWQSEQALKTLLAAFKSYAEIEKNDTTQVLKPFWKD